MLVLHTPPFKGRSKRGHRRAWHPCNGLTSQCFTNPARRYVPKAYSKGLFVPIEWDSTELEEVETEYYFCRAIPGISPSSLAVDIRGPFLIVKSLTEIPGERFSWRVIIPEDVRQEYITADVENGLLNVRFPKLSPRSIPILAKGDVASDLWRLENWNGEYKLTHPAIGVAMSDVKVVIEEGYLFVKVSGKNGRFAREVALPPKVDVDSIKTQLKDGLLIITLPKIESEDVIIRRHSSDSSVIFESDESLYEEARQTV